MVTFAKRFALVFGLWTVAAICGGVADYFYSLALGEHLSFWGAFRRPLTEQWIWAALTPLAFFVAHRFPLTRPRLARAIGVHAVAFISLSLLHCVLAEAVGEPLAALPAHYNGPTLPLRFFEEFYGDIWMYWPLVCIQALIDSHARARQKERHAAELEALLAKSHLALLRAQIQPHFLFNTLHALSALIRVDPVAAEDMVADLAEILRASSAESGLQETSLRRELELVACYLRIQQRRFGDRLRVSQVVAPEVLEAAVPALVLQSLVENAVAHGIAPLGRCGSVEIRVYRREGQLVLQVEDDGVGMPAELAGTGRGGTGGGSAGGPGAGGAGGGGTGLANARRRMTELYGDQQSLKVTGMPGRGVSAIACIPFRILSWNTVETEEPEEVVSREHTDIDSGRRSAGAAQPVVSTGP
jgi:two-component system LytT family sensor kinase